MYYFLYPFLYIVSLLPFFILYRISDLAYIIIYHIVGYRKKVVMSNLDIAFPEKTVQEKIVIAKKFYKNLTDTFIESIKLISISEKNFLKRATANMDAVIQLAEKGKNIQFHCGHQFNWEYGNWIVAMKMPIPFIGIYMRLKNRAVDKIFYKLRSRPGTILVAAQEFRQKMHQLMNKQYSIGLAADQNPGVPPHAYWLHFFNRPTPFVTGPDKGAVKNNTAVVFIRLMKRKRGYYHYDSIVYCEDASSCKEGEITLKYRDFLEETIKAHPDNYLWSHRRWKSEYNEKFTNRWIDSNPPDFKLQ
ncbi:MAG: lipid A biosynthesis acyltransferase [Ferruginibacter sp.]|nr:lipid A biosynthesis acyltransferase [Ferruginibacter sp.]